MTSLIELNVKLNAQLLSISRWTTYVDGFDALVWTIIAVFTIISTSLSVFVNWILKKQNLENNEYESFGQGIFLHISSLLQQGLNYLYFLPSACIKHITPNLLKKFLRFIHTSEKKFW